MYIALEIQITVAIKNRKKKVIQTVLKFDGFSSTKTVYSLFSCPSLWSVYAKEGREEASESRENANPSFKAAVQGHVSTGLLFHPGPYIFLKSFSVSPV